MGRLLPVALCAVVLVALSAHGRAAVAADRSEIEIRFMNGVYENLDSDLEPIQQGGMTIRVSSPEHRVTVHGNRLQMTPGDEGTLDATMAVDFEGGGRLVADVESIGRFVDDVEAPRQTVQAAGRVRLEKADGGYLFTVVEADPYVQLEIRSGIARQMVTSCRSLSLIPFFNLPCDGIEESLSKVTIPMPEAGEQFVVSDAELTAEEKAFFERFVAVRVARDARSSR